MRLRAEHDKKEAEQKRRAEAKRCQEADKMHQRACREEARRRQIVRDKGAMSKHRRRVTGKRFPEMPGYVRAPAARKALAALRQDREAAMATRRVRARMGADTTDLDHQVADLLEQARLIVRQECANAHVHSASLSARFPRLPRADPRSAQLAELCQKHRSISKRFRKRMPEETRRELNKLRERVFEEALDLLKFVGGSNPDEPATPTSGRTDSGAEA